ncbi:uncharacterized protein LAESUDRAFT_723745 [Laetiporus sulphureus 93-53]|uniref:Uncharacterized protein n=1 Tax=Laetiporus sulphureus 93-53 TaxID=1314785 RepID=A0A165FDI9_9APHY|nr:uncharacterized protein LAESUDRAFT_723745 [Laetiporus sulphureus 93-53]KZT08805.1 hypothetical protein LAESUDRAFT_723745 [Laetiporus sulphureus 93-53]
MTYRQVYPCKCMARSQVAFKQNTANESIRISSILISRFILNLRQVSLGSMGLNTTSHSSQNTPDFPSRLVGNFGAEVQHTSLVFENVEDNTEDEQNISGDCEVYELAQVQ